MGLAKQLPALLILLMILTLGLLMAAGLVLAGSARWAGRALIDSIIDLGE